MKLRMTLSALVLLGWPGVTAAQEVKPADSAAQLAERNLYRRAVEAVI